MPRPARPTVVTVTVPLKLNLRGGVEGHRRYLETELKRYFPFDAHVLFDDDNDLITALVKFAKGTKPLTLTYHTGSDDSWYTFIGRF